MVHSGDRQERLAKEMTCNVSPHQKQILNIEITWYVPKTARLQASRNTNVYAKHFLYCEDSLYVQLIMEVWKVSGPCVCNYTSLGSLQYVSKKMCLTLKIKTSSRHYLRVDMNYKPTQDRSSAITT